MASATDQTPSTTTADPHALSFGLSVDNPRAFGAKAFALDRSSGAFVETRGYGLGKWFDFEQERAETLDELEAVLRRRAQDPFGFLLLGEPIDPTKKCQLRRTKDRTLPDGTMERATLRDVPRAWLALDLDDVVLPPGRTVDQMTPEEFAGACRALLPEEFWFVDGVLNFTASHGLPRAGKTASARCRMFFLLDRPITADERRAWFTGHLVDASIFGAHQPIYISAPEFQGCADPVGQRWHRVPGGNGTERVPVPAVLAKPSKAALAMAHDQNATGGPARAAGIGAGIGGGWRTKLDRGFGERHRGFVGMYSAAISAVASLLATDGPDADPRPVYSEIRRLFAERNETHAPGYDADLIAKADVYFRRLVDAERAKTTPMVCPPPPSNAVPLASAEQLLAQAVEGFFARAVAFTSERDRVATAVATMEAAAKLGRQDVRDRIGLDADPEGNAGLVGTIDGVNEPAFNDLPPHEVVKVSVGLGKTRAVIDEIAALPPGVRVLVAVADHRLAGDVAARLAQHAPNKAVAVWRGEAQPDPRDPSGLTPMCAQADDVAAVRRAGGKRDTLCGGPKRGFCSFHEARNGGAPACGYRNQWPAAQAADVLVVAGSAFLADAPHERWSRAPAVVPVVDPATGAQIGTAEVERPAFDLLVVDEPALAQLIRGLEPGRERTFLSCRDGSSPNTFAPFPGATAAQQTAIDAARDAAAGFVAALSAIAQQANGRVRPTYGQLRAAARALPGSPPGDAAIHARLVDARSKALAAVTALSGIKDGDWRSYLATRGAEVRHNSLMLATAKLLASAAKAFDAVQGAPDTQPIAQLLFEPVPDGAGGQEPGIAFRSVENIDGAWHKLPTLVLDATARPALLARWWPRATLTADVAVVPDRAVVRARQVHDQPLGYRRLKQWLANGAFDRIATFVEIEAARVRGRDQHGIDLLVIAPQFVEDQLKSRWGGKPPAGVEVAHFNNLRGVDRWAGVAKLVVISRPLPPPSAVEDLAGLVGGVVGTEVQDWDRQDAVFRMSDGTGRVRRDVLPRHPDPAAEEWRGAICDDELVQAVGRGRANRRTTSNPLEIDIMTIVPVDGLPVDELVTLDELLAPADAGPLALAAARGVVIDPKAKGAWPVIAAVVGGTPTAVRFRHERSHASAPFMEVSYKGAARVSAAEGAETEDAADGWTRVRLRIAGTRYAPPALVRARDLTEAQATVTEAARLAAGSTGTPTAVEVLPAARRSASRSQTDNSFRGRPHKGVVRLTTSDEPETTAADANVTTVPGEPPLLPDTGSAPDARDEPEAAPRVFTITRADLEQFGREIGLAGVTVRKTLDALPGIRRAQGADELAALAIRRLIAAAAGRSTATPDAIRRAVARLESANETA